jgi:ADP-ribose pyrophosphatase YjhB (NUDIX family)
MSEAKHESNGPAVLVQTFIFAQAHVLLMKRGIPPYTGKWAPPGGFVEPYESAEAAAIRETREEVGIELDVERLLPLATASVSSINQIYLMFIAYADAITPPLPRAPEALDARWFPQSAFPMPDIWDPISHFDMTELFDRVRLGRFEYYQRTDDFHRVISEHQEIRYLRRAK